MTSLVSWNEPDNQALSCGVHNLTLDDVEYRLYSPKDRRVTKNLCVYAKKSTLCIWEDHAIPSQICRHHGLTIEDITFYEMRTHVSWTSIPSGFYTFTHLTHEVASDFGRENYELHTKGWNDVECPISIYQAFKHLIGDFWTVEQVISKQNPIRGRAYANYDDQRMCEELEWGRGHLRTILQYAEDEYQRHREMLETPEGARKRGCQFIPSTLMNHIPNKFSEWKGVFVDMKNSHLRGQLSHNSMSNESCPLHQPMRFAFWERLAS